MPAVRVAESAFSLVDADALRERGVDRLVHAAVFDGDADVRDTARWLIGEAGRAVGVAPASIHDLYMARGRGEVHGFTVPAMNVRAASYDTARALFSAAREMKVGALILEIARSEIGYTDQRPGEYVAAMTAAAIRGGGAPLIQVDHSGTRQKFKSADAEVRASGLIRRRARGFTTRRRHPPPGDANRGRARTAKNTASRRVKAYVPTTSPRRHRLLGGGSARWGREQQHRGGGLLDARPRRGASLRRRGRLEGLSKTAAAGTQGGVVLADGAQGWRSTRTLRDSGIGATSTGWRARGSTLVTLRERLRLLNE